MSDLQIISLQFEMTYRYILSFEALNSTHSPTQFH